MPGRGEGGEAGGGGGGGGRGESVTLWAGEGVYHEEQANWLETFCEHWKKVVEGVRSTEKERNLKKECRACA